ncbi:hypothetical protein [Paraburkholderia pallida]|uniref:EpsG family protein n=1 Tax=Paraburkholderia pallida TaxID=2547399 RepID=A0A4P7CP47_9BURK|nr:hypothetical protein [Paraburkholderia pallida]QBQ96697.1 hypothetical protein E1956_05585 [Paraburkholderia pallida]
MIKANTPGYRSLMIRRRNKKIVQAFIVLWILACLCFSLFAQDVLPAKYLFDAGNIASRFGYVDQFAVGEAYDNTALFYELCLLSESQHLAAFVTTLLFSFFILKCGTFASQMDWGAMHSLLLFTFICVVSAVYLGQYSKEATSMLITMSFFGLSNTMRGRVVWMLIACIYATYFRAYWVPVVILYIYYGFVLKRSRSIVVFLSSIAIAILLLALAFKAILGVDLAYYRYMVNDTRTYDANANTMIVPLLPTGGIGLEWLNGVVQYLLMFFPIPLISGNPLYLAFVAIIGSIGVRIFMISRAILHSDLDRRTLQTECLALVVSFVTVQSIFEPDYGSYIRHLLPMLPLVLYVMCVGSSPWHVGKNVARNREGSLATP